MSDCAVEYICTRYWIHTHSESQRAQNPTANWVTLNTPNERCTCQVWMPSLVGFIFLALPESPFWPLGKKNWYLFAKFGAYGPKLL